VEHVLAAIAEPSRLRMLRLLLERELTAGELAAHFPRVSRPNVSQHVRVLREAGLVDERQDGTRRYYRIRPEAFAQLRGFLEPFWTTRLAQLKRGAEAAHRKKRQRGRK
jgi:DNA-binding transcriptional ArsR family regulator